MPLLIILITATASYILSQKIGKTTKNWINPNQKWFIDGRGWIVDYI
jgi:hypothetical protein